MHRDLLYAIALLLCPALSCGTSDAEIADQISKANFCSQPGECVNLGAHCPFGCAILVNKDKANEIRSLLSSHKETCAYDCVPIQPALACEGQICKARPMP